MHYACGSMDYVCVDVDGCVMRLSVACDTLHYEHYLHGIYIMLRLQTAKEDFVEQFCA